MEWILTLSETNQEPGVYQAGVTARSSTKLTMPHDAAIARSRISKFLFFLPSSAYDVSKTVDTRCNMVKVAWRALSMGSVEP